MEKNHLFSFLFRHRPFTTKSGTLFYVLFFKVKVLHTRHRYPLDLTVDPYCPRCSMDSNEFLSSEAERALMGEEEEARRLFRRDAAGKSTAATNDGHQQTWPSNWNLQGSAMQPAPNPYTVPSSPYSAEPWPQQTWQTLHPDDFDGSSPAGISDISRSSSPNNPADLQNFGHPLPDGRSWRCAHPGCTSQATFIRGCDLRKHFRRHTKSLFCRHEDCPQSTEGGFSSKKDRDRHEAKHRPGVSCEWEGCDRKFSRVDNMKDHVRRIHRKVS